MRIQFSKIFISTMILFLIGMPTQAISDELTQRIQKDLVALGYDPGNIKGEADDDTVAAVPKINIGLNWFEELKERVPVD